MTRLDAIRARMDIVRHGNIPLAAVGEPWTPVCPIDVLTLLAVVEVFSGPPIVCRTDEEGEHVLLPKEKFKKLRSALAPLLADDKSVREFHDE